jgi:hypothetical protein
MAGPRKPSFDPIAWLRGRLREAGKGPNRASYIARNFEKYSTRLRGTAERYQVGPVEVSRRMFDALRRAAFPEVEREVTRRALSGETSLEGLLKGTRKTRQGRTALERELASRRHPHAPIRLGERGKPEVIPARGFEHYFLNRSGVWQAGEVAGNDQLEMQQYRSISEHVRNTMGRDQEANEALRAFTYRDIRDVRERRLRPETNWKRLVREWNSLTPRERAEKRERIWYDTARQHRRRAA